MLLQELRMKALALRKAYQPKRYVRQPHRYSNPNKAASHMRQAAGYKDIVTIIRKETAMTPKKPHSDLTDKQQEILALAEKIKAAKHSVRNASTRRSGLSIDAGIRELKLELRALRGKRRK